MPSRPEVHLGDPGLSEQDYRQQLVRLLPWLTNVRCRSAWSKFPKRGDILTWAPWFFDVVAKQVLYIQLLSK